MTTTQQQTNGNSKAMVQTKPSPLDTLRGLFEKAKPSIAGVLPKHLTPEKITKLVLSAASRTPDLLECTPHSILLAVMQSAALGLEPNTPTQQAYLIPYWNSKTKKKECQFIPGYRGLITLAVQSGEILSVQARAVYEKDYFEVEYGLDERLVHKPAMGDRGKLVAVYSVAKFANGSKTFEVMTREEVDVIRANTKAKFGPWVDHFDEMAKKTVIRRHSKVMPMNPEKTERFTKALEHQGRAEQGIGPDFSDMIDVLPQAVAEIGPSEQPQPQLSRGDALAAQLGATVPHDPLTGEVIEPRGREPGDDSDE